MAALADIHHQGFAPGGMSDHGEDGEKPRRRRSFIPALISWRNPGQRKPMISRA
jgi:hypothetical protein